MAYVAGIGAAGARIVQRGPGMGEDGSMEPAVRPVEREAG